MEVEGKIESGGWMSVNVVSVIVSGSWMMLSMPSLMCDSRLQ